jgi:hypothetical protein
MSFCSVQNYKKRIKPHRERGAIHRFLHIINIKKREKSFRLAVVRTFFRIFARVL